MPEHQHHTGHKKMDQRKLALIIAGGLLVAYLIYRHYQNTGSTAATSGVAAPNTGGADYAALAGQEQGDVAALQGQNQQLASQEKGDFAGLTAQEQQDIAGLTGQEQGDIAAIQAEMLKLVSAVAGAESAAAKAQQEAAAAAAGYRKTQRGKTITTHKGGAFYNWYVRATGHPPPATLSVTNFFFQAWQAGVKAAALRPPPAGHHAGSRNPHVAHPNPGHHQQHRGGGHTTRSEMIPRNVRILPTHRTPPQRPTRPSGRRK